MQVRDTGDDNPPAVSNTDVEQREGRILRQGNECAEVEIIRYVTEGSFDAYSWQTVLTKAKFIAQVMSGDRASGLSKTSSSQR